MVSEDILRGQLEQVNRHVGVVYEVAEQAIAVVALLALGFGTHITTDFVGPHGANSRRRLPLKPSRLNIQFRKRAIPWVLSLVRLRLTWIVCGDFFIDVTGLNKLLSKATTVSMDRRQSKFKF